MMRKLLSGLSGAWATLGVATALKVAAAIWLAWWALSLAAWSRSTWGSEPPPLPDTAYDALVVMVTFATLAALFALIVTVVQSLWLRPVPRGWIGRSVAAAAAAAGFLGGILTVYNHTAGLPNIYLASAELAICALAECASMFVVQCRVVVSLAH